MERLREIQPAHKSDKITVAQAKKAWLKVERENGNTARDADRSRPTSHSGKKRDPRRPAVAQDDPAT